MPYRDMKKFLEWQTKRRLEWKRRITEIKKKAGGCKTCGWNKHPEILQHHHRNKKEKKMAMSIGNLGSYSWERILKELEKCDLLCPNCHFWLHYLETGDKGIKMTKEV